MFLQLTIGNHNNFIITTKEFFGECSGVVSNNFFSADVTEAEVIFHSTALNKELPCASDPVSNLGFCHAEKSSDLQIAEA